MKRKKFIFVPLCFSLHTIIMCVAIFFYVSFTSVSLSMAGRLRSADVAQQTPDLDPEQAATCWPSGATQRLIVDRRQDALPSPSSQHPLEVVRTAAHHPASADEGQCKDVQRGILSHVSTVPAVMEKSWKMGKKNKVMEIENILNESWISNGISPLLITNHT